MTTPTSMGIIMGTGMAMDPGITITGTTPPAVGAGIAAA